jgi:hypothetical protein
MRSVFVGLCACVCVAFAAPAFGETHEEGKEQAAEPAVEEQAPAVKAGPAAEAGEPAAGSESAAEKAETAKEKPAE